MRRTRLRRLVIFLSLVLILAAMFQLSRLAADWHYIVPATAGELLYATGFDGDTPDWQQTAGQTASAQSVDGSMRLEINTLGGLSATTSPYFRDFDATVEVRVETGVFDGNNNNGYGIIFRQWDPNSFYVFLVSSDGSYRLRRVVDGQSHALSDWIFTDAINQQIGALNTLRVVGEGDRFRFYINGQRMLLCVPDDPGAISTMFRGECLQGELVDTLVDDSVRYGRLGVYGELDRGQETGIVIHFDNFIVYGPQPDEPQTVGDDGADG